jgi:hypothetical protein
MNQYCVYTSDKKFSEVIRYISENKLAYEPHLNRTRFWVPESMHTEFLKEWGGICTYVHPDEDLTTGYRQDNWDNWKASKDLGNSL